MNEFSEKLEKFIEDTVKKTLGKYCMETNNKIEILATVVNTLRSVLIVHRFPSTEELKALMNKVMENKAVELNKRNFGEKSEEPKN